MYKSCPYNYFNESLDNFTLTPKSSLPGTNSAYSQQYESIHKGNSKKFTGVMIFYYHGSTKRFSFETYINGMPHGLWITYHPNGNKKTLGHYFNNQCIGIWVTFHDNGEVETEGEYASGMKNGLWRHYYPSGAVKCQGTYLLGVKNTDWNYFLDNKLEQEIEEKKEKKSELSSTKLPSMFYFGEDDSDTECEVENEIDNKSAE